MHAAAARDRQRTVDLPGALQLREKQPKTCSQKKKRNAVSECKVQTRLFRQASVEDLIVNGGGGAAGSVGGVVLEDGCKIRGLCTVLTTGTFLRGVIHMGR